MSENSYRWRGELNRLRTISITSSDPRSGESNIPERSFMFDAMALFDNNRRYPHRVTWYSKLRKRVWEYQTDTWMFCNVLYGYSLSRKDRRGWRHLYDS
jgi:hypothetical protein